MSPAAWQAISAVVATVGTVIGSVAVAMIGSVHRTARQARDSSRQARDNSRQARDNTSGLDVDADGDGGRTLAEILAELQRRSRHTDRTVQAMMDTLGRHLVEHERADEIDPEG